MPTSLGRDQLFYTRGRKEDEEKQGRKRRSRRRRRGKGGGARRIGKRRMGGRRRKREGGTHAWLFRGLLAPAIFTAANTPARDTSLIRKRPSTSRTPLGP